MGRVNGVITHHTPGSGFSSECFCREIWLRYTEKITLNKGSTLNPTTKIAIFEFGTSQDNITSLETFSAFLLMSVREECVALHDPEGPNYFVEAVPWKNLNPAPNFNLADYDIVTVVGQIFIAWADFAKGIITKGFPKAS
jgi:hypothetical protein